MKRRRSCPPIQMGASAFAGYRFPPEVIVLAVQPAAALDRDTRSDNATEPVWMLVANSQDGRSAKAVAEPAARARQKGENTRRSRLRKRSDVLAGETRSVWPRRPSAPRPASDAVTPATPSLRSVFGSGGVPSTSAAAHTSAAATATHAAGDGTSLEPTTESASSARVANGNDEPQAHNKCTPAIPVKATEVNRDMRRNMHQR